MRTSRQNPEIRDFILRHVREHPADIVLRTMQQFGYSRPGVLRYVDRLVADGLLAFHGTTADRRYELRPLVLTTLTLDIDHLWSEDDIWREKIAPHIRNVPRNVIDICRYGFTEILNNVLDHARSPHVTITYRQDYSDIDMVIADSGIGIFRKIQNDFRLDDPRTALLELSKGKLTSDSRNHAGEGIYFTSRMFNRFRIRSGHLFYSRERRDGNDWLIEVNDRTKDRRGTLVMMRIRTNADWTMRDVFNLYQGDSLRFRKTHVPLKLAQYPGEQLVSRSQAKRLLARFENFTEVYLDFQDVPEIGQPFTDEIFRIFHQNRPEIGIQVVNANDDIRRMIDFVIKNQPQPPTATTQ